MELSKKTNQYTVKQQAAHVKEEVPLHCEINLPEYFFDIAHILKCTLKPNIQTVLQGQDKILIEGMATLKILYISDEKIPRCYCQNLTFSKTIDFKEISPSYLKVTAKTEYTNCRVPSPRKIEIHGALSVDIQIFTKKQENLLCACEGGQVQTKSKTLKVTDLLDCASLLFPVNETLELPQAKSPFGEMVRNYVDAKIESTKIVSGKVLLKGKLHVECVYISKEPEYKMETMSYALPFSQIAELPGAKESAQMLTDIWVSSLELVPKPDATGTMRLLECKCLLGVFLECYQEEEKQILLDAYSTKYNVESKERTLQFSHKTEYIEDLFLCRSTVPLEDSTATQIASVQLMDLEYESKISKGKLVIYGSVVYEILYCSAKEEWKTIEKKESFQYERELREPNDNMAQDVFLHPNGIEYLFSANDHIDIRMELHIEAHLAQQNEKRILSDITVLDTLKPQNTAALTVYFAKDKETLWDIARKYNTTVLAIQTENQLKGDILEESCTLFIPRV